MSAEDREAFRSEMGIAGFDRDALMRTMLDASGQMLYFTAGEKEVRTWMLRQGGTALEAADNIHTDLARGFIRAEVMQCDDLVRLGSEREIKAAGPGAAGAEGLRHPRRRHSEHSLQRVMR